MSPPIGITLKVYDLFVCCCRRWHLNISEKSRAKLPNPWPSLSYLCHFPNFHFLDILLQHMQLHFQIHLKTYNICLFVAAGDDISIYQRLPVWCTTFHSPDLLQYYEMKQFQNLNFLDMLLHYIYATAFTYRCQYLMKLNSLDKRRCFRTSNIYSMFYQHIHINQIYLTDTLLNLYPN